MIISDLHSYSDGEETFIGRLAYDDSRAERRPAVLVTPAFSGRSPFEEARAEELAALGYVALAVDYYGEGRRAEGPEQASEWMRALNADRPKLARRMNAALETVKALPNVDPDRVGAIGYCFGGKCVLDLARSGAEFRAAVSLHGIFDAPPMPRNEIRAAVLALHGWDDPLCPPEAVLALAKELTESCADWQLLAFGHTCHAFTNPAANAPERGMMFSQSASRRSWEALTRFLEERLAS